VAITTATNISPRVTTNPDFTKCASATEILKAGRGINFNGSTYAPIPAFSISAGSAITVEFWVDVNGGDIGGGIFNIGNQEAPNKCQANVSAVSRRIFWDYGNTISADFNPYFNKQTHVALVANGAVRKIYINGISVGTNPPNNDPGPDVNLSNLTIGRFVNNYFKGQLDQFRIWNAERTEAQIREGMYEEYPGNTGNLIGSWRFDEDGGSTLVNDVNPSQTGTLNVITGRGFVTPVPTSYTWTASGSSTTIGSASTLSTNTSTNKTYYVRGANNGCSHTASVNVTVNTGCRESISEETEVESTGWSAEIFPNPSMNDATIVFEQISSEKVKVEILDMKGVTVGKYDEVSTREPFIFGSNFRSGIYMIKIWDQKEYRTLKFIKQE
jgi:hypothetical protein